MSLRVSKILGDDRFDLGQRVVDDIVAPFGVAQERVGVGEPHEFGGRWGVGLPGEEFLAHSQRPVPVLGQAVKERHSIISGVAAGTAAKVPNIFREGCN